MSALGLPLALWYFKYTLSGSVLVISQTIQVSIVVSGGRFPSVSVIITHTRHKEQQWFLPGKEWNLSTYFYHTIRLCTRVVILTFSDTLKNDLFWHRTQTGEQISSHTGLLPVKAQPFAFIWHLLFPSLVCHSGVLFLFAGCSFHSFSICLIHLFPGEKQAVRTKPGTMFWFRSGWQIEASFFCKKKQAAVAGTASWKEGSQTTNQCRRSFFWNHDTVQ